MGRVVFYAHAGAGTHGCEAIVCASKDIIGASVTLCSMNTNKDRLYSLIQVKNFKSNINIKEE